MRDKIINIHKPIGISPLDVIRLLQKKNPEYKDTSITYAGRLDPIAEGVLLLLVGDEVHKAEEYMKLDKEYEAEILFGFSTDTYDILGIAQAQALRLIVVLEEIKREIKNLKGEISLPLPPYSSYKIKGKPLFMWAREGKLDEIEISTRTTQIHKAEILDSYEISENELLTQITKKINLVKGDFRQEEIMSKWREILNMKNKYLVIKVRFNVSSGTYIRSIAHHLGGTLLGLVRTKVGEFDIKDSILLTK